MIVTVPERLILLGILPKEGNILTLKIVRDLLDEIGFSDVELVDLQLKPVDEGRRTVWDADVAERHEKDINFGVKGVELVRETLQKLDSQKTLPMAAMSLWEKFVEAKLKVVPEKPAPCDAIAEAQTPTRAVKRRQSAKSKKK